MFTDERTQDTLSLAGPPEKAECTARYEYQVARCDKFRGFLAAVAER